MMNNVSELISVIIPVYNVENYLEKCIKSITNQTYKNLEIVIVDDGSTDSSSKICDELGKRDSRLKIIHKSNSGVSAARNEGLRNIKGIYFIFIDSDDYIESDMIEELYNNIKKSKADVSICNVRQIKEDGSIIFEPKYSNQIIEMNSTEFSSMLYNKEHINGYPVNKLFLTSCARGVFFDERIKHLEDWDYLCRISKRIKKAVYADTRPYYSYIIRNTSAVHEEFNDNWITDLIARKKNIKLVDNYNEHDKIRFFFDYVVTALNTLGYLKYNDKLSDKKKDELNIIVNCYFKRVLFSKYISMYERIKLILKRIFPYKYFEFMVKYKYKK